MSLKENFERDLAAYCYIPFKVNLHAIDGNIRQILYEDREMSIETIPLKHVVPCCGFLFREKPKARVLLPEKCLSYGISTREFGKIKAGADYTLSDGKVIPNEELTAVSEFIPRSYAFCSDTAYYPEMVPQIEGVDVLYHESTFTSEKEEQATTAGHSTAEQAAMIARAAKMGQLVLGHYSIRYAGGTREFVNEARCIFGNSIAGEDGITIPILHTEYSDVVYEKEYIASKRKDNNDGYIEVNRLVIDPSKKEIVCACKELTEVVIPSDVTSIGNAAFKDCKRLTSIEMHDGIANIGKFAFKGCTSLEMVKLPGKVDVLRDSVFRDCSSLKQVFLSDAIVSIEKWAFRGCSSIEVIQLPDTVNSIGVAAFQDCVCLSQINLPEGIEYIKLNAFKNCASLKELKVPTGCLNFEGNDNEETK
jgi:ribonuclease Z